MCYWCLSRQGPATPVSVLQMFDITMQLRS